MEHANLLLQSSTSVNWSQRVLSNRSGVIFLIWKLITMKLRYPPDITHLWWINSELQQSTGCMQRHRGPLAVVTFYWWQDVSKYGWSVAQQKPEVIKDNVLGFHSMASCDPTSSFSGSRKKSCWKIFEAYPHLLPCVGKDGDLEMLRSSLADHTEYEIHRNVLIKLDMMRSKRSLKVATYKRYFI